MLRNKRMADHLNDVRRKTNITPDQYDEKKKEIRESRLLIEERLTGKAERFLSKEFGLTLDIPVIINARLSRCRGYYKYSVSSLTREISARQIEISETLLIDASLLDDYSGVESTLFHECTHYALHILGKPYQDGDTYFEETLKRLNINSSGTQKALSKYYVYECEECSRNTKSRQRLNVNREIYICSECDGSFKYKESIIE